MNRQQKENVVAYVKDTISQSQASFVIGYKGLSVQKLELLRRQLREKNGSLKITKARLMKRAVDGVDGVQDLAPHFKDQVGLVFVKDDSAGVAKVLYEFAKANKELKLVVGCLDARLLDHDQVIRVATLPSKEVLLAQLCGTIKAPITGLVSVLSQVPTKFVRTLKAIEDKKK